MQFFHSIVDFFQEIFRPEAPEVKKRVALRKIEASLRTKASAIYKSDALLPNFAEAMRVLYINTKPLHNLLSQTISSDDLDRNHHFIEQLILTGLSDESQTIIENLSYQNRKAGALKADSLTHYFEREHVQLEKVVKELKSQQFIQIDNVIDRLKQLNDICRFNYMTILKIFDPLFNSDPNYKPEFQEIPLSMLENSLLDLYYITADMDINNSTKNAVRALFQLLNRLQSDEAKEMEIAGSLRKIQGILKNILPAETLLALIRLAKGNPTMEADKTVYKGGERKRYAEYLENRFIVDEGRLKNEIQDETISNEVKMLFGDTHLLTLKGYNNEINDQLKQSTPCSFFWVLPMQVLKTFLKMFFQEHVKPLLNDIAIEGFFNSSEYKTDFSAEVYAASDSLSHIEQFEMLFDEHGTFDEQLVTSLIRDSHKDNTFLLKLKDLTVQIDKKAREILQTEASNLYRLSTKIAEILAESKKPTSDTITNLKVLMISSRNRDNSEFLEKSFPSWKIFLEIMKEYVILDKRS